MLTVLSHFDSKLAEFYFIDKWPHFGSQSLSFMYKGTVTKTCVILRIREKGSINNDILSKKCFKKCKVWRF